MLLLNNACCEVQSWQDLLNSAMVAHPTKQTRDELAQARHTALSGGKTEFDSSFLSEPLFVMI